MMALLVCTNVGDIKSSKSPAITPGFPIFIVPLSIPPIKRSCHFNA
jgi:hypothetical protein